MRKLIKFSIIFIALVLKTPVVLADPLCWLRTASPADDVLVGPIQLDSDWRRYNLVRPFRVSPHIYRIELLFKQTEFDLIDIGESGKKAKAWIGLVPQNRNTKKNYYFEVKVRNSRLGWINLMPISAGTSVFNGKSFIAVGYGNNPEKLQGFYPPGSVMEEVHLRSDSNVTVEHVRWTANGYWQWPCRKWSEVPDSQFVQPESKSPP